MSHAPTVLVVDDDSRCRALLKSLLEPDGYRVLTADNGQEAIAFAVSHQPDLVLLDVMMPDMDGYEVCRLLRSDKALSHLPIIFTTALDDRKSRLRGIEAGADDFVTKPIDLVELRARVRSITRLNRFRLQAEERARFEQVVAASPDGIAICDPAGRIHLSNTSFRSLFGSTKPTSLSEVFQEADWRRIRSLFPSTTAPRPCHVPFEVELPGSNPRTLELTLATMPWDGGIAHQVCVRDITEKKGLECQLMRAQRIDLLGQLAGGIIHDVNNLLSTIAAHASLMAMDGARPEDEKRLSAIETASYQGGGLLRQLLLFARGHDGEMTELDTMAHLYEFHAMVQQSLGARLDVALEIKGKIPPLRADGNQVNQVLMNLCVNARDAMEGTGRITLRLGIRPVSNQEGCRLAPALPAGDYVVYEVADTGCGIPDSIRNRLFEPFFTTKPAGKGTGLGLATVQRVLQRHQGGIAVESIVGQGTTFLCYFPLQHTAAPVGAALQTAHP
ncbi:response regulator [Nibricoccus sp. IMCC34717]|uniref:response regulator n=1 Tax=Nibricoccus sp. IMCC34717 TaxID=3034021 RepID=UPI00384D1D39